MQWVSAISTSPAYRDALDEATEDARDGLGGSTPDLVLVFVTPHHRGSYGRLASDLRARFGEAVILGTSAGGIVGAGREVEQGAGLAITAAVLPGVELTPFHLEPESLPGSNAPPRAWHEQFGTQPGEEVAFLLLPDPFTCDGPSLLEELDRVYPGSPKVGALASGGSQPGETALWAHDDMHTTGAVGLVLRGNVDVQTVVAQGCRPIGNPMFITRSERNIIYELDGRSPPAVVRELYESLDGNDQERMRHSLFVGLVMSDAQEVYSQGDYLIRNIIGLDARSGALAIGALAPRNLVVQFHLRDAQTSSKELHELLARHASSSTHSPAGALMFSCLGRGEGLYGRANHDVDVFREHIGVAPIGGFFGNGEIGPVHGQTFLHGYTSVFALFRPKHSH